MSIQNLIVAAMQALVDNDTEAIKEILKQDIHADYIFPLVSDGRVQVSAWDLFMQGNVKLPERFRNPTVQRANYNDALGNILLHQAASISDYELVTLLLENGADVTSMDRYEQTALHIACREESLEIIKFLTEKSPAYILDLPDMFGHTPLDVACTNNRPDVVQFLLSQGSSVGAKDVKRHPLLNALFINRAENAVPIASLLLDAGANVKHADRCFGPLLIRALELYNSLQMELTENSTTSQSNLCVNLCIQLIDLGCDVNATGSGGTTALHLAVMAGLENLVWKLLISGSDADKCDSNGDTPLHLACLNGNQTLVKLLIASGANLRAVDWKSILKLWRYWDILNERNTQLLNYIIDVSKQHRLTLQSLCFKIIRKNMRNVEMDASQLGLPPLLVTRLLLKG